MRTALRCVLLAMALVAAAWGGRAVGLASAPAPFVPRFAAPAAPAMCVGGEQPLDTEVPPPKTPPARKPLATPAPKPTGPKLAKNGLRAVRTPADEELPAWVPISGRLTVLESSDLAENLGLLPMGWAKAHPNETASVAELLEAERAARAAAAPSSSARTWTYIAGETFVGL